MKKELLFEYAYLYGFEKKKKISLTKINKWLINTHKIFISYKIGYGDETWFSYHIQKLDDDKFIFDRNKSWYKYSNCEKDALYFAISFINADEYKIKKLSLKNNEYLDEDI